MTDQTRELMFSSNTDRWSTPQDFYDKLDAEFHFNLDPCADESNHKCDMWYSPEQDGLKKSWGGVSGVLQSSIRQGTWQVGREGIHGKPQTEHDCGDADSCQNGYEMVSRLHSPSVGSEVYKRAFEVWRFRQ